MVEDVLVLQKQLVTRRLLVCLNPCCGGRCSSTPNILGITNPFGVLILVVVEDVLVLVSFPDSVELTTVLILVVVEDVLVLSRTSEKTASHMRLNPCCGGRCSSTTTASIW